MNITCDIYTTSDANTFNSSTCNNTEDKKLFEADLIINIITILISFPINSYVIWLIVTGTGNGLAAEFFILNLSVCEILYCIDCALVPLSYAFESLWGVVHFMDGFPTTGRPLFECLMCVERYLAVVHPVTFLKYKPLRYKLMCSAVVWLICFCFCIINLTLWIFLLMRLFVMVYFAQFLLFLIFQLFCCLAVLRALKQSGPGERGREREEENHMKRRAFNLILITTVTMVIIYVPEMMLLVLGWSSKQYILFVSISYLFFLFAGLVQPFLFLYRVGKLTFIKERINIRWAFQV